MRVRRLRAVEEERPNQRVLSQQLRGQVTDIRLRQPGARKGAPAVRIATLILSLILMLVVGAQSCAVSLGDAVLGTKAAEQGGPIGLVMAFLFLVGGASHWHFRSCL